VKKFRGALPRPFVNWGLDVVASFLIAGGYCGQATQSVYPSDIQEVVGVLIPS
jgi:hypothetical protein